jgi:hypothetical protein
MAPPELELIQQILGSPSKLACSAWFADKTDGWQPWAKSIPSQSTPDSADEICKKLDASCTYTAFNVAKLLSAKEADGKINFDLDGDPKEAVASKELEQVFDNVNKVFWVRANLDNGLSHAFVVTSYAGSSGDLCCGLYMSYAAEGRWGCGYTLPDFLKGDEFKFSPKMDKDIPIRQFTETFGALYTTEIAKFQETWKTLFKCGPGQATRLKEALVKVLDRTLPQDGFLEKLKAQWPKCPHELDV